MKNRRTLGFILLVLLIASLVFLDVPDKSHTSLLDDERSYFSKYGVGYGGYVYASLNKQIVKIPLDKDKINANAEFVINFPGDESSYIDEICTFIQNGGNLYINIASYMMHGGLFRMTPDSDKPEFVVKADTDAGMFEITDSNRHPETLKFLRFSDGDAYEWFGDLYGYLPSKNKAAKLTSFHGDVKINDFIGITSDDAVLASQVAVLDSQLENRYEDKKMRLEGVDRITMNPETGEVKTERLLDVKDMPETYFITPSPDMEKLYLFGAGFSVYDVKRGSLKQVVEFNEIIKNWPDNASPYLIDNEYDRRKAGEDIFMFVIDDDRLGRFYITANDKAILIDAFNETYESVNEVKGDHLW
ncbi:MAG: hypothetical protein LBL73_05270 [Synergistaceae bacterium]|jgi:hypothetical protein|nr:hypothetical protein [Synergistaceae bacterium]